MYWTAMVHPTLRLCTLAASVGLLTTELEPPLGQLVWLDTVLTNKLSFRLAFQKGSWQAWETYSVIIITVVYAYRWSWPLFRRVWRRSPRAVRPLQWLLVVLSFSRDEPVWLRDVDSLDHCCDDDVSAAASCDAWRTNYNISTILSRIYHVAYSLLGTT